MRTAIPAQPRPRVPSDDPTMKTPDIAWPTLGLFAAAGLLWIAGIAAVEQLGWSLWFSIPLHTACSFMMFTVLHDGVHRSLMRGYPRLNEVVATVASVFLSPVASAAAFRYAHFAHHRHTNHPETDPDMYSGEGPAWLLPLRWATADLRYAVIILQNLDKISRKDKVQIFGCIGLIIAAYALAWQLGYGVEATLYWLIPSRLAVLWLAFAFNFLPHHPHETLQSHNPYAATNVRQGGEPLMTWLFLYQNYHLIHHLFPSIPFYRYVRVWQRYGDEFQAKGAPVVPALGLEPVNR